MKKKSVGKGSNIKKKAASTGGKATQAAKKTTPIAKKTTPITKKTTEIKKTPVVIDDKKLSAVELESFKEKLLVIRTRLRGNVITMADAALNKNRMEGAEDHSTMPIHMADIGSDNFEQEQTLSFVQSEHGLLEMVDEALVRVKEGTYGICEGCECRIPKARLNAIPYAVKCVKCAASDEQG